MNFSNLEAISPVDGRYRRAAASLGDYFSEGALIKYRVRVEIEPEQRGSGAEGGSTAEGEPGVNR